MRGVLLALVSNPYQLVAVQVLDNNNALVSTATNSITVSLFGGTAPMESRHENGYHKSGGGNGRSAFRSG